ncbi:hypothetical protein SARC_16847, partial [Sphaeroforma arctica JP610]
PYVYLNPIFNGAESQQSEDCEYIDGEDDKDCIFESGVKNILNFPNVRCNSIQEFKVEMFDNDTGFDDDLGEFDWMYELKTMNATGEYKTFSKELDSTFFSNGELQFKVQIVLPRGADPSPSPTPSVSPAA